MTASLLQRAEPAGRDRYLVKSVVRCCQIVRALQTREDGLPLLAIARRTGLSKSLVFRLLRTLRHIGWVEQRNRTYHLLVQVPRRQRKTSTLASSRKLTPTSSPSATSTSSRRATL